MFCTNLCINRTNVEKSSIDKITVCAKMAVWYLWCISILFQAHSIVLTLGMFWDGWLVIWATYATVSYYRVNHNKVASLLTKFQVSSMWLLAAGIQLKGNYYDTKGQTNGNVGDWYKVCQQMTSSSLWTISMHVWKRIKIISHQWLRRTDASVGNRLICRVN
jgi:hypothetical protein